MTRGSDGSFRIIQSRVVTAGGVVVTASTFVAEILIGLFGIGAARKGAQRARHRAHQRQSGVGRDADRLTQVFDHLGPKGACVLFHFMDEQMAQVVAKRADERGDNNSHLSRSEFLAALDRLGSGYDWLRPTVDEPTPKKKKHHISHRGSASS